MNYRNPRAINLTPIFVLVAINCLIFIAMVIASTVNHQPLSIITNQMGISASTFTSHPWTIISAMFTHGSWMHIIFNMITLYFYGMYVLALVGEAKFFIIYFLGGLAGNALFLLLAGPNSVAVGASGAIFALGGALAVLAPKLKIMIFPIPIPMDLWIAILIMALISLSPGIAWQAHIGGLIVGLIAGYIFRVRARRRSS